MNKRIIEKLTKDIKVLEQDYEAKKLTCSQFGRLLQEKAQRIEQIDKEFASFPQTKQLKMLYVEYYFEKLSFRKLYQEYEQTAVRSPQNLLFSNDIKMLTSSKQKLSVLEMQMEELMQNDCCKKYAKHLPTILGYYRIKKHYENALNERMDVKHQLDLKKERLQIREQKEQ